jgi:hypothetical protein
MPFLKEVVPFERQEAETLLNYIKGIAHRLFAAFYLALLYRLTAR